MTQRPAVKATEVLRRSPILTRTVALGEDLELRVQAIIDPASVGDQPVIDVRLFHRPAGEASWSPSHHGLRVPLRLSGLVADALRHVGARAAEHLAMTPPRS